MLLLRLEASLGDAVSPASSTFDFEQKTVFRTNRDNISNALFAILQYTQRTLSQPPFGEERRLWTRFLPGIMPNLADFMRALHSLNDRNSWQGIPSDFYDKVTSIPVGLKKTLLSECSTPSAFERKVEQSEVEYQLYSIRHWMQMCQHQWFVAFTHGSCQIVGFLSNIGPDFYLQEALVRDIVQRGMYSFIHHLDNKNLVLMLSSSVKPLVINCPKELYHVYLSILLPDLLNFLINKLDKEWKDMRERGNLHLDQTDDVVQEYMEELNYEHGDKMADVSDDIIAEQQLRNLTRVVGKLFNAIFAIESSTSSSTATTPVVPMGQLVVRYANTDLVNSILGNEVYPPFAYLNLAHCRPSDDAHVAPDVLSRLQQCKDGHWNFL